MAALDDTEARILRALRTGWWCSVEIAERAELPSYQVRHRLAHLLDQRLIARGTFVEHARTRHTGTFGEYSITERGLLQLAALDQLRLC